MVSRRPSATTLCRATLPSSVLSAVKAIKSADPGVARGAPTFMGKGTTRPETFILTSSSRSSRRRMKDNFRQQKGGRKKGNEKLGLYSISHPIHTHNS